MNFGTFLVASVLLIIVILDIRYLWKKRGSACSGDCSGCHGTCRWTDDLKKARAEIRSGHEHTV